VPYKYGCYSYSANADLTTMAARQLITETATCFSLKSNENYLSLLSADDKIKMMKLKNSFEGMNADRLMWFTYVNYPYYAINSLKAEKILSNSELLNVVNSKPVSADTILYTLGYEGISLEAYLNKLIINDVKLLVDVRRNPLSMKYGFSKSQLMKCCEALGINYIHIPEVGIASDKRKVLETRADYDALFKVYRKENLSKTQPQQSQILGLLMKYERIALTCFESDACFCHRKHLADAINDLPDFTFTVKHI
ncbi:MAG: DUF488 family protein, partial [Bacteroidia bacterium]